MRAMLLLILSLVSQGANAELKSKEIDLFDAARERPVKIKAWFQTGDNCNGELCVARANKQSGLPVALISHGAFGSPREMNWLGNGLAKQGWLVIGVAHYGESWVYGQGSIDRSIIGRKWLRGQDLSFVIDQLYSGTLVNQVIDKERVVVIGHSLGGYSALNIVGADYNATAMFDYCKSAIANDMGCRYGKRQQNQSKQPVLPSVNVTDSRVTAVVALDPALGPSVSKSSLSKISVPVFIVGSVENDFLDFSAHAEYYASSINQAELVKLEQGEGHFVYLDACQHNHQAMGISLCKDRNGVDRTKVHASLLAEIDTFLSTL